MFTIKSSLLTLLTHRRGACLALVKIKNDELTAEHLQTNFRELVVQFPREETIVKNDICLLRTQAKTAESLYALYAKALSLLGLQDQQVDYLIVGTGPGSFTGLRIGCAFANGLSLGRPRHLISMPTCLVPDLKEYCLKEGFSLEHLYSQLGEYEEKDESTGSVTFYDLLASFQLLYAQALKETDFFNPHYGKEPGPVIKLREQTKA
ncbi:MAG: hypothetical protein K2X39_03975 [Silvanigrellaceae bacterium]|nr:hypothetical protein [Silvanigrellaceae bacterium]